MATNIESTAQLNKMIQEQNQLYLQQIKILRGQAQMLEQIVSMTQEIDPSKMMGSAWNEVVERIKEVNDGMGEMGETTNSQLGIMNKAQGTFNKIAEKTSKILKSVGKAGMALGAIAGVVGKVGQAFSIMGGLASGALSIIGDVLGAIKDFGMSIITAPFKILDGLIGMIGSGSGDLRKALEDIRKEFGSLHTGASKAIISISKSMRGQLAETGLSTWRIFGNLAQKLGTITEYAQKLGPLFTNLSAGLMKNAEAFGAYVKGLGLTDEGLKGVGRQALIFGKSFTDVGREITGMAYQLGPAFGINGKEVSRAIGDMMADVKNFGSLSIKQLGQISVFTRKLGMDFKDLLGIIDKFDNFEDAATSVAQLTQAFGMNIDAFELMKEQDPAARFETIRKAFYQTGRSVENMTRQELKLLASQTGLTEESVKLGFSMKSQGMTYDQVQKKAAIAEKKQLSQAEAMKALADSIERLVQSGATGEGGFFDRFIQGFMRGIEMSKEFRELMRHLSRALMIVFRAGIQTGRAFVEAFLPAKTTIQGLADLFEPKRWKKMMNEIVGHFKSFFKSMNDPRNAKAAVGKFLEGIQNTFLKFFNASGPAAASVLTGFKDMLRAIIRGGTEFIIQGIEKLLEIVRKFISGDFNNEMKKAGTDAISQTGGFLTGEIEYILGRLQESDIFSKVKEIFTLIWGKITQSWNEFWSGPDGEEIKIRLDEFWADLKPKLINAAYDIGKEIGTTFLKAITNAMYRHAPSMISESKDAFKAYTDGLKSSVEMEELRKQLSRPVSPDELFGDATGRSIFEERRDRLEEWNNNQLKELRRAADLAHEAVQDSSGAFNRAFTDRWQTLERKYRNFLKQTQEDSAMADRIFQRDYVNSQKNLTTNAENTTNRLNEQITRQQDLMRRSSILSNTDTGYLRTAAPRATEVTAQDTTAASVQDTISSQAEAIEAVEEFNRVKNIRLPSETDLNRFVGRMTKFLDVWKTKVAGSLEGFNKGWNISVFEGVRDLVNTVNLVTEDMNKISKKPREVNMRLKELAGHLGMGSRQQIEVKNKSFAFAITVNVTLDADEFESALQSRPGGSHFEVKTEFNKSGVQ